MAKAKKYTAYQQIIGANKSAQSRGFIPPYRIETGSIYQYDKGEKAYIRFCSVLQAKKYSLEELTDSE